MTTTQHKLSRARALESLVRTVAREVILPRYLNTTSNRKADGSLFTEADLESQKQLVAMLPDFLPGSVLGEEMTSAEQEALWNASDKGLWCIDPIDGTTNFINGIPFFAVSVAYLINREPQIGVVYNPVTDESFYAAKGGGAYLNGTKLPLRSAATRLSESVAGIDFKRIQRTARPLADALATQPPYYSQRNFGSSALEWCFVAAGRLDVYIHGGQMLWDYAAGRLVLDEAGGKSAALDGRPLFDGPLAKRGVIAANTPSLFSKWHDWIFAHLE